MTTSLMSHSHRSEAPLSPWAWLLARGQATTLQADAVPRWLRVDDGCVWLTAVGGDEQAQDIWLAAGDSMALPAGVAWVLEAWPQARLSLLQQAPAAAKQRAWFAAVVAWLAALSPPAVPGSGPPTRGVCSAEGLDRRRLDTTIAA